MNKAELCPNPATCRACVEISGLAACAYELARAAK